MSVRGEFAKTFSETATELIEATVEYSRIDNELHPNELKHKKQQEIESIFFRMELLVGNEYDAREEFLKFVSYPDELPKDKFERVLKDSTTLWNTITILMPKHPKGHHIAAWCAFAVEMIETY